MKRKVPHELGPFNIVIYNDHFEAAKKEANKRLSDMLEVPEENVAVLLTSAEFTGHTNHNVRRLWEFSFIGWA